MSDSSDVEVSDAEESHETPANPFVNGEDSDDSEEEITVKRKRKVSLLRCF